MDKLATQPALVSRFCVDSFFLKKDSGTSFLGNQLASQTSSTDYHAMLLIGYRREGNDIIFLLQNWWKDRYLIEISANYLKSCAPDIIFASSSLTSIPSGFPVLRTAYAETSVDCGEKYDELMSVSIE